jgi:hypothetical protein
MLNQESGLMSDKLFFPFSLPGSRKESTWDEIVCGSHPKPSKQFGGHPA